MENQTGGRCERVRLDEEVEDEEKQAEGQEEDSGKAATTGELTEEPEASGRDYQEAGFAATLIKRTRRHKAAETAAKSGNAVVQPKDKLITMAPELIGAKHKKAIPQTGQ